MNSVEALTDRPTSDPSENGIMEGTGLPRSQAANVGDACSSPASRLAASTICRRGDAVWRHPMRSFPGRPPQRSNRQRIWDRRSVVLLALALRTTA